MKIMYWVTWVILLFAVWGALNLSHTEWIEKDVCPKIIGIPACYIVLSIFFSAAVMHLINVKISNYLYFALLCIPLFLALKGSIIEITGTQICPRSGGGTPMCFYSLALCVSLMVSKFFAMKSFSNA